MSELLTIKRAFDLATNTSNVEIVKRRIFHAPEKHVVDRRHRGVARFVLKQARATARGSSSAAFSGCP